MKKLEKKNSMNTVMAFVGWGCKCSCKCKGKYYPNNTNGTQSGTTVNNQGSR